MHGPYLHQEIPAARVENGLLYGRVGFGENRRTGNKPLRQLAEPPWQQRHHQNETSERVQPPPYAAGIEGVAERYHADSDENRGVGRSRQGQYEQEDGHSDQHQDPPGQALAV